MYHSIQFIPTVFTFALYFVLLLASSESKAGMTINSEPIPFGSHFDVIVIGGGASGCAFASRLVQESALSVLLVERGKSDLEVKDTQSAEYWPDVVNSEASESIRFEEGTWGAIGKVLGGGSSVNDGLFLQESGDYFKDILSLDNSSESDSILMTIDSIFQNLAKQIAAPANETAFARDMYNSFLEAGLTPAAGHRIERMNQGTWMSWSTFDTNKPGFPRSSSASLIHQLKDVDIPGNLTVKTEVFVEKILFRPGTTIASGVQIKYASDLHCSRSSEHIFAGQIVLAAGAILSPQILQISGVGPRHVLEKIGVTPVLLDDRIGRNFLDRLVMSFGLLSKTKIERFVGFPVGTDSENELFYEVVGGGSVASEFAKASAGLTTPRERNLLVKETLSLLMDIDAIADGIDQSIEIFTLQDGTKSRGFVEAQSSNIEDPPVVSAAYFDDPEDLKRQVIAFKMLYKISSTESMKPYLREKHIENAILQDLVPGKLSCIFEQRNETDQVPFFMLPCPPDPLTDDGIEDWIKKNVVSSYHYFGTLPLGKIVDPRTLQINGLSNIMAIDASILPKPTRVNPQATIMAIGEFAALVFLKSAVV